MRPKALVFDLDGVLVHSEPVHVRTWVLSLAEFGVDVPEADRGHFQGRTAEQVAAWVRERHEGADVDGPRLVEAKRRHYAAAMETELEPVPGVDAFLRRRKGETPLALVTSSGLKTVGRTMLIFNWRNVFDALVGAEHVANPKPHPEPYLHVAQRLRLRPEEMLVFEDSRVGIESARAAGAPVCGVATTLDDAALREAGATWTIRDFEDEAALDLALEGVRPTGVFGRLIRRIAG